MTITPFDPVVLPAACLTTTWLPVAARSEGGAWSLPLAALRGSSDGPCLVVLAGVHGDEYEGVEAIARLCTELDPAALRGTLLMVPICNPPAYAAAQRNSAVDGLNLARVFPGNPDGTLTERIAHVLTTQVIRHADLVVDLHSGGVAYDLPTLVGYLHDEGEMGRRSLAAARAFGAPVLWGHPLPIPAGRSISAAQELGIPWLYTEASGGGYARPADVACYARGVVNLLRHLGMLDGAPDAPAPAHHLVGDGNLDTVIDAPVGGYFRAAVALLDDVDAGQPLGHLYDPFGARLATVSAPCPGVVILLRRVHRVHAGEGLVHLTQRMR